MRGPSLQTRTKALAGAAFSRRFGDAVMRTKIASSESRPTRRRKLRVDALIRQAEKAGKVVTSITTPDGTTLRFGEAEQDGSNNSWDEVLRRASH